MALELLAVMREYQSCGGNVDFQKRQTREGPRSVASLQIKAMCTHFDLSTVLRGG